MISSLQKNALPVALLLLVVGAMYLVYRDMRNMEARIGKIDAALVQLYAEREDLMSAFQFGPADDDGDDCDDGEDCDEDDYCHLPAIEEVGDDDEEPAEEPVTAAGDAPVEAPAETSAETPAEDDLLIVPPAPAKKTRSHKARSP